MGSITLQDISKAYGAVEVIHGIDLDVANGEFVVLVGPSGCGKSTLLRMIAGLEAISGGVMSINGKTVNRLAPKDRDIAMVFQNYALYPHMTIAENMGFSLRLRGTPKAEIDRRVAEAARVLHLEPYVERKPRALSGGQRQRVAMGRAIVRDPEIFLFDEPLSNLDAKLRVTMRTEIKELHQRLGITTIYVTHDQTEAMTMADRIVVLNGGHVEQIGAPLEIYDRPASIFVATFIGMPVMNIFEGTVDDGGHSLAGKQDLVLPLPARRRPGRNLALGIRPTDIVVDPDSPLGAEVVVSEPTGAETQVHARLPGGADISIMLRERRVPRAGEILPIRFDLAHSHVFDADTGKRLAEGKQAVAPVSA